MDNKTVYPLRDSASFRANEQAKVDTVNSTPGSDDGTGVDCPLCMNRGYSLKLTEDGYLLSVPCKCEGQRKTVRWLKGQGLYDQAMEQTLDSYKTDSAFQSAMKQRVIAFLEGNGHPWLILCGQPGAGKTHLCVAAFYQMAIRYGLNGRLLLWLSDGRRMKAAAKDGDEHRLNEFKNCELLYVDDFMKCKRGTDPSDADIRLAMDLLDHRCRKKLPTIISTELTLQEIRDLDEAIYRRIHQMCGPNIGNIGRDPGKCFIPKLNPGR